MTTPTACRYTESHEWFRTEGDLVTVGITQFAANELTDITYVEMKPVGASVQSGESLGEVESVKTTSDVYAAIGGEIVEVNEAVAGDPAILNRDPYEEGWLVRIRCADLAPLEALMDQATYDERYPLDG